MFKELYRYFVTSRDQEEHPKAGDVWAQETKDPFKRVRVHVKEVREGYVRYRFFFPDIGERCESALDNSLSIPDFMACYKRQSVEA